MKGLQNRHVDQGPSFFDAFLRALARWGSWASAKEDARMYARRRAAALARGTRIRITGRCCAQDHTGKFARIHSYIDDADDYRITYEEEPPRSPNPIFDYHSPDVPLRWIRVGSDWDTIPVRRFPLREAAKAFVLRLFFDEVRRPTWR